jgi:hypothetical protein
MVPSQVLGSRLLHSNAPAVPVEREMPFRLRVHILCIRDVSEEWDISGITWQLNIHKRLPVTCTIDKERIFL